MKVFKQSNKSIYQPCRGEILVAWGKVDIPD